MSESCPPNDGSRDQDNEDPDDPDVLVDDSVDFEEFDDHTPLVSSSNDQELDDSPKDYVLNCDGTLIWKTDDDSEEPSNSRAKAWQQELMKCPPRNPKSNPMEESRSIVVKLPDFDQDCSNQAAATGGSVSGCASETNEAPAPGLEDLFASLSASGQNSRSASLPPSAFMSSNLGTRFSNCFGANNSPPNFPQSLNHQQNHLQRNKTVNHPCPRQPFQSPRAHQQQEPQQRNVSPQRNKDGNFYNWQSTKMTVKDRLAFLFNTTTLSDVTFVVGRDNQEQRIPAHRFVLSVGSAVFDAMFNSAWPTNSEEIPLPDVEPASFLALLKFLYSDEVQICPETVMTTLYTAKKYAVPALEKNCVDYLKRHLCADNAFLLLTQARLFDEPQLAALCLETIDKATPDALAAEGFTDIDVDTLSAVLDRDSLRIKEAKLFSHVIKWSEAECVRQGLIVNCENKRSVLGPVLSKIRFPLMTVEEFAQGPAQSGILADRECVSLFLHFTVNPKPPVAFLDVPRCSMTGKEQTVCRFQQIESRWGYSGTADKIRFVTDRKIFVVGFGLYGSIHGPSEYQVSIQILQTTGSRVLASNENSFASDGTNATFRVMFKEPVEIQPGINYTASATLKGLDSHYGTKGLRKVTVDCYTGGKVTFQFSYAAGNNNGTSVEDGQIPEIIFYT